MIGASARASILVTALALAACNQSAGVGAATGLDPTGLSGAAISMTQSAQPEAASSDVDFSSFAPRLTDIAAGNTARPNHLAAFDRQAGQIMAMQAAGMARTVGNAAVGGALTGGVGLAAAAPSLAMQAATAGMMGGQLSTARGQASAAIAQAEAERAAKQLVPDADRPAEARAVLSVLDGTGGVSATWQNPSTGASGKVTVKPMNRARFGDFDCRLIRRELRSGGATRTGEMLACRSKGEWYELS